MADTRFNTRQSNTQVNPLFTNRWSPRQYNNAEINQADLNTIFDAARFSPSCYNAQPWRFISCTPASHSDFLALLVEANQNWAKTAPLIGFIVCDKHFEHNGKDNAHAEFDTGAAWMAMSLQASLLGYYAHGMGGIKYDDIYQKFDIDPAKHTVICGFTLGKINADNQEEITSRKSLNDVWQQV